ncbi:hypothetical protein NHH03_13720 [Stieleria sp. TO1_6]|uniref:hypothetical protein n=1 Tax=Stieleria tagensis TaxID=2956795 RepID=UPI00209ADA8F|nr:hypothetical protein [Stieleria tagensis]MCO8122801.1 hypothetical protein [Stieleria tagensis]
MTNPYKVSEIEEASAAKSKAPDSISKMTGTVVGGAVGAIFAAVVSALLSFLALIPPLNRLTQLVGEFDGLILVAMPPIAAGCGALAGVLFCLLGHHRTAGRIATAAGSLPALIFFYRALDLYSNDNANDSPIPALVIGLILILAVAASVLIVSLVLSSLTGPKKSIPAEEK